MKKYLMIGFVAAVAFSSCSKHDFETMSQEQIDKAKYDQKFVETFGTPDPNHTWGFGATTRAFTRANVNVNGNQWETCPEVTAAEAKAIYDYVNRVKTSIPNYSEEAPDNLQNYYVTQVSGGKEDDEHCVYSNYDNTVTGLLGSTNMNHLNIAQSGTVSIDNNGALQGDWVHINNFNAGDNYNWGGNTLITDGGTLDFAYHCTQDSKYHNKWIIIDGQYITDDAGNHYPGKYYVCFDFVSWTNDVYYNLHFKDADGNSYDGAHVMGPYGNLADATAANATVVYWKWNGQTNEETTTTMSELVAAGCNDWRFDNLNQSNMYYQANEYYTDWIVRLVEAQPKNQITYAWRIMAEDLTVATNSDFDFNDVVFDAKIDATANKTYIKLLAAGGTLELYIGDESHEVHHLFNVGKTTMVNTINPDYNTAGVTFELPYYSSYEAIPIYVKKNGVWEPITAQRGTPAAKFACPVGTEWQVEYTNINEKYSGFNAWVADESASPWEADF